MNADLRPPFVLLAGVLVACSGGGGGGGKGTECVVPPGDPSAGHCLGAADCDGDACVLDRSNPGTDGEAAALVYGSPGSGGAPGDACGEASDCAAGLCAISGFCVEACGARDDCGATARCRATFVRTGASTASSLFACVPHLPTAPGIEASARRVPSVADRDERWVSVDFGAVTAPGDVFVVEGTCGADVRVVRFETRGPTPETLFDAEQVGTVPFSNPIHPEASPASVMVPSGSDVLLSDLGYRLLVRIDGPFDAEVTELRGVPAGAVLDLDLFYVGGHGWAAEGTRGPAEVDAALAIVEANLADLGITLGDIRQHDVEGALRERFEVIGENADLGEDAFEPFYPGIRELSTVAAGLDRPSIAVFFVKWLEGSVALTSAIPAVGGFHGTSSATIVVGADALSGAASVARILTHELGHALGLFHTTEFNGLVVEALADTPACAESADADANGIYTEEECAGMGGDNRMFWQANGTLWSDDQRTVAARARMLRAP
ncbi:MAG: hypothetical protein R3A78_11235 [Polyangiales bacterium]